MSDGRLVVIGDALLDLDVDGVVERLSPDAPVPVLDQTALAARPGGAGLAAALVAADGHAVTLVTALADDAAGARLRRLLDARGIDVVDLGLDAPTPEKIRLRTGVRALLRLDRGGDPAPHAVGPASAAARAAIGWAQAILVADYGRGVAAEPGIRAALAERAADGAPIVWDPHPRGPAPVRGVTVATPNAREAAGFAPGVQADGGAAALRERWGARYVCITRGAGGALLCGPDGAPVTLPARPVEGGDPCGAGDRFAARLVVRLAAGWSIADAAADTVACASTFVAAGGASALVTDDGHDVAAFDPGPGTRAGGGTRGDDALARARAAIAATRARGGTVVATGGCFDLLHAGHVRTLEAARALGDCLVVCLNSDASVRRLKGPERPLVPACDRAAVLAALRCVDAVVSFEEDTPETLLDALRPDVWAKGGDYAGRALPEAPRLAGWGGRAVLLPYHAGHSTTRMIEEARNHVAH